MRILLSIRPSSGRAHILSLLASEHVEFSDWDVSNAARSTTAELMISDCKLPDFAGFDDGKPEGHCPLEVTLFPAITAIELVHLIISTGVGPSLARSRSIWLNGREPSLVAGAPSLLRDAVRYSRLTSRQKEVLALLRRGFTNRQIAAQLGLTEGTVKQYVSAVLRRLGVNNRTTAAMARHLDMP